MIYVWIRMGYWLNWMKSWSLKTTIPNLGFGKGNDQYACSYGYIANIIIFFSQSTFCVVVLVSFQK